MALQLNIEDLLNKRKIESNRIEFKKGWNPSDIYQTICAFANDFENLGGGYILVGVEQDENGIAKRPVKGLPIEIIDKIKKDMVGYDAKIKPAYVTRAEEVEVDGNIILAIWAPARNNRPYSVPENVVAKQVYNPKYYIRSKASTIEAKGEILHELFDMANNTPFDERGNSNIKIADISPVLVYNHLVQIGSKLVESFNPSRLMDTLDAMELLIGPSEDRMIKNVAAMMFCQHPEKFFPTTQVEIVIFPEGSIENPDLMVEAPIITGPIPSIIRDTLSYLKSNVIKQVIIKHSNTEESEKKTNYPYQAFEEAVVNALYHRNYQEREPVEITIEPDRVEILSHSGPDRSISDEAIKEAKRLKTRKYRNRRLGDFLKELDLSEGRATGIPTIQKHLKLNGSDSAIIDTDSERSYFLMTIPCRKDMVNLNVGHSDIQTDHKEEILSFQIQLTNVLEKEDFQVYVNDNQGIDKLVNKLVNLYLQVYLQAWEKIKVELPILIEDSIKILFLLKEDYKSINELLDVTNVSSIYKLKQYFLLPLIKEGYVEIKNPNKPTSPKQAYRLSEKGKSLI
ncbi:MAG: putative DNA binding domain-containing protein [Bacteroidales bacterium]|nr:putative DNA binding domain-containing protein [Bacteroidales bacterium]